MGTSRVAKKGFMELSGVFRLRAQKCLYPGHSFLSHLVRLLSGM